MSIAFGDYTSPEKEDETQDLTIGVFFDGTIIIEITIRGEKK